MQHTLELKYEDPRNGWVAAVFNNTRVFFEATETGVTISGYHNLTPDEIDVAIKFLKKFRRGVDNPTYTW